MLKAKIPISLVLDQLKKKKKKKKKEEEKNVSKTDEYPFRKYQKKKQNLVNRESILYQVKKMKGLQQSRRPKNSICLHH